MKSQTYWYAFQKEVELRGALLQCAAEVLLSPYQLWRFERSGDGKRFLLLCVQDHPLPGGWGKALTPESVRELHNVQFTPEQVSQDHPAEAKCRLSLREVETDQVWGGWSFPQRQGQHLLSVLGLELSPTQAPIAWVLFSLPNDRLREAISDHLTLNNYELRCSHEERDRQWLWVRHPELYLILKFKEIPGVEIFQSFPEEKALFTPWGQRSLLGEHLCLPQGESLLVLDQDGGSQQLDTASWWMANELITIEEMPVVQGLAPSKKELRIPIHLRYHPAEQRETPRLWLLKGSDALPAIEALFFELGPEERSAIGLFVGEDPEGTGSIFILRDDRPYQDSPLFSLGRASGFEPFFPEEGLYIKSGYRIYPTLPSEIWRKEFNLDTGVYTLLEPNTDRTSAQILRVPQDGFAQLEHFVHYRIGAQSAELRSLAQSTAFDILFSPTQLQPDALPQAANNKAKAPKKATAQKEALTENTALSAPSMEQLYQGAGTDGYVKNQRLQQMEQKFQQALRKGTPLTPHDWVTLSSLYQREYKEQRQNNWLQETFKALDQVLYLDRHAADAVSLEHAILRDVLQVEGLGFREQMQRLDEWITQSSNEAYFFGRLAFRLRARMLLDGHQDEEQMLHLRLHFYRDLAAMEDHLMIREHYIYVAGVAQFLGDNELFERARLRYRQLLEDRNRLQRELPAVLVQ